MKRATAQRHLPRALRRTTPVAAAALAVLCWAPDAVMAQSGDVVTITGIRRGIESAISTKKNADGVVEAISAEDIGKLPDTTIAESLARLPGITTQRDRDGNATNINIRGLGPDFNGYLLNGREQASTTDSRNVDLSVYPAELIGGATVYKTGDANLMAAGLAGTIDNKLIDPLSLRSRVFAASVVKTRTGVGLELGPGATSNDGKRYSIAYVDQFADRTLGVAIGYVKSDSDSSSLASGSWGSTVNVTTTGGATGSYDIPFAGGLGYETDVKKDKREGLAAILSYKPNKNFQTELDIYSAKIKTNTKINAVKGGTWGSDVTNATLNGSTVTSGTFNMGATPGSQLVVFSENRFDDDKIDSFGWKTSYKFADTWTAALDLNSNKAKRVSKDIEVYAGITTPDTLSFTTSGSGTPQFQLGNPGAYTDPAQLMVRDQSGWSGVNYPAGTVVNGVDYSGRTVPQAGYSKGPTVTDKIDGLRLDFRKDFGDALAGWFTDVQFGLNYSKRSKDRITDEGLIISTGNAGYDRIAYPGGYVANNIGGTGLNVLTFDPTENLWAGATLLRKYNDDILSKTWTVQEKVSTAFAKLNIDTSLARVPVTGNVGVQLVHTDQSSSGYRSSATSQVTLDNPAGTLRSDGTTYDDVLPSLNLRGDLGSGNVVRLGLSRQIARPLLTDMRNSFGIGLNTSDVDPVTGLPRLTASGGNPNLKPFRATALDVAYEKYFGGNKGYVGAAAFYKNLDSYITTEVNVGDLSALAAQYGVTGYGYNGIGVYNKSVNRGGGNISGIELAASIPFSMFTPVLEGFGVTGTYSYTDSSIDIPYSIGLNPTQAPVVGAVSMQLPGLSKQNTSLTFYYERAGFSAFVARSHRSRYNAWVANNTVGGYPSLAEIYPQTWVSAQIGYEFQDGVLKGLGIRLEGNNINSPTYRDFDGSTLHENKTGATYGVRVSYKL